MNVQTDHYFAIGSEHVTAGKPCQDHALSFADNESACIVVADGCSSGKETDMGARVITFSTISVAKSVVSSVGSIGTIQEEIRKGSQELRNKTATILSLHESDLLATRVYALYDKRKVFAAVEGDGVIAWKNKENHVFMLRYDWAENTPCYPSYGADNFALFKEIQGSLKNQGLTEAYWKWSIESGFELICERLLSIDEAVAGVTKLFSESEVNNLSFLLVASDGVTQVDEVDWKEVVVEILSFKSVTGQFLKRRLIRMHKEWMKKSVKPLDDIAVACISFSP